MTILIPARWLPTLGAFEGSTNDLAEIGRAVKDALLYALEHPMGTQALAQLAKEPVIEAGQSHRLSVNIPSGPGSVLKALADSQGLTVGPTAKRLVGLVANGVIVRSSAADPDTCVPDTHPMAVLNTQLGLGPRAAQAQLYENLWESLCGGSIGLVEGGTGIGKTRAMLAAATRWVQERNSHIGICAPTIALLRQIVQEHDFQVNKGVDIPEIRLYMGRSEFVSELELTNFISTRGSQWDTPAVRNWLLNGAGDSEHSVIDTRWQIHSLLKIAPDIPLDEVRLEEVCSHTDRGLLAYRRQFDAHKSGNSKDSGPPCILLFSHAMLAQDMRRKLILAGQDETYLELQNFYIQAMRNVRGKKVKENLDDFEAIEVIESELGVALNSASAGKAILPTFVCLMIDEGHVLEEAVSISLSDYVSLASLLQDLRSYKALGARIPADGIGVVERAIAHLIAQAPTLDRRDFVALSSDLEGRLVSQLAAIGTVCEEIPKVRDADSEKFRLCLRIKRAGILISGAIQRNNKHSFLRHSPVKHLPQLMVSNSNVQTILSRLWSSLESAALVSATLYIPTLDGPSANFISNLLRIPLARAKTFEPVNALWSTRCVQGVWIAQSTTQRLYPPSSALLGKKRTSAEYSRDEAQWHADLAQEIEKIWRSSAGGVLVLCTSYATVSAVYAHLCKIEILSQSLVKAVSKVSVRSQSNEFLTHSKTGRKPLWLGVGSAWTGVDIGGHDPWRDLFGEELAPEQDNVLTDLVIPRLPYGTNQSLSHLWRIRNNPNVPWDLMDASLRFKQALGRLVRRNGLPSNRRIFVLDARLSDSSMASRLVPFIRALSRYRVVNFSPD